MHTQRVTFNTDPPPAHPYPKEKFPIKGREDKRCPPKNGYPLTHTQKRKKLPSSPHIRVNLKTDLIEASDKEGPHNHWGGEGPHHRIPDREGPPVQDVVQQPFSVKQ